MFSWYHYNWLFIILNWEKGWNNRPIVCLYNTCVNTTATNFLVDNRNGICYTYNRGE